MDILLAKVLTHCFCAMIAKFSFEWDCSFSNLNFIELFGTVIFNLKFPLDDHVLDSKTFQVSEKSAHAQKWAAPHLESAKTVSSFLLGGLMASNCFISSSSI